MSGESERVNKEGERGRKSNKGKVVRRGRLDREGHTTDGNNMKKERKRCQERWFVINTRA